MQLWHFWNDGTCTIESNQMDPVRGLWTKLFIWIRIFNVITTARSNISFSISHAKSIFFASKEIVNFKFEFKLKKRKCTALYWNRCSICFAWYLADVLYMYEFKEEEDEKKKLEKKTNVNLCWWKRSNTYRFEAILSCDRRRKSTRKHHNNWLCLNALGTYSKHTNLIRSMEVNNILTTKANFGRWTGQNNRYTEFSKQFGWSKENLVSHIISWRICRPVSIFARSFSLFFIVLIAFLHELLCKNCKLKI